MGTLNKSPAVHYGGKKFFKIPKEEKKNVQILTKHKSVYVCVEEPTIEDNEFFLAMTQLFGNIFRKFIQIL